ncbi:MAG: hypothetical protein U0821_03765 [Chloroflexota bacterium]
MVRNRLVISTLAAFLIFGSTLAQADARRGEAQPGDDRGGVSEPRGRGGDSISNTSNSGPSRGTDNNVRRRGEPEPGDDRGGHGEAEHPHRRGGGEGQGNGTPNAGPSRKGTRVIVTLTPSADFPNASGKAKSQVKGTERELEIEVEHITALAGTTVTFKVGGSSVGTATVSALGEAELDLSTEDGDTVPTIGAGASVSVTTADGTVIVEGQFP